MIRSPRPEAELALRHARETANPTAPRRRAVRVRVRPGIADDPAAALAAFDESIALGRQGASPTMFAATLIYAAGVRVRTGDLPHAARDLREGVERSHQTGFRTTFYSGVWWGIEILIRLDHLEQAAVFDGIASTSTAPEYPRPSPGPKRPTSKPPSHRARTAYGPDHYDAAFQTGAQMTYDQAVEYTLGVLDDVINETNEARSA